MKKLFLIILTFAVLTACNRNRSNLLILHADQLSQWAVGAYELDDLRGPLTTPNLDALASDGMLFTNFFTNSAVCSPSRALMMTGCYAGKNGVSGNDMILNSIPTLANYLNEAGYTTGYAGKWHLSGKDRPGWAPHSYGWTDNRFMFNRGHYKRIEDQADGNAKEFPYREIGDESTYTTDWLANKTIEFIQAHQSERFAFMVSFPDPHQPWQVREPYNSMYDPEQMTVPESYVQRLDPLTAWHQEMLNESAGLTPQRLKLIKSMYSGSSHLIDYSVGRILDVLKELDLYEKTLIVFTADHGEYMGEHGLLYKNHFFETAYRLPFIMRIPEGPKGIVNSRLFGMVDFMPGILSLLDIEPTIPTDGGDFSVILNEEPDWAEEVFVYHSSHSGAGLYTKNYYLVLHQSGDHLLINRAQDPLELYNLYYDPEFQDVIQEMKQKILTHHHLFQTPELEWLRQ